MDIFEQNNNKVSKHQTENFDNTEFDIFSDIDKKMKIDNIGNLVILTQDNGVISQSIKNILTTQKGSRIRFPEFGTNLLNKLFQPITNSLLTRIKTEIQNALEAWENRIKVLKIQVTHEDKDKNIINIDIYYYITHTGKIEMFNGRIAAPEEQ